VGVAAHLPARFAVIEDVPRGTQRLYRLGDRLDAADGTPLTLTRIEADRVVLEAEGVAHVLARGEESPERRAASHVAARAEPPGGRALVRRGRGDEYVVDRRAVEATFADFGEMSKGIRVIPNVVAGESVGYRVFGIDAASLFARLGLRNGDVVQRVNAVALTDPGTALGILRDLPRERRIVLDISRQQRPQTLTYEIQ
jgi:general secretion pathway protein C